MGTRIGYRCAAPGGTLSWRETEDPSRRFTHGPGVYFTSDPAYAERYCLPSSVRHKVEIIGLLLPSSSLVIKHPDYVDPAPEVRRLAELPEYQQLIRGLGRTPRWNVATALAELVDELGPDKFLAAMRRIGVVGTVGRTGHLPEEFAVFDEMAIRKMGTEGLGKTPVNETRPRKLAVKRTGSYDVLLVERDETYYLAVRYTGQWASGDWIEVTPKIDQWVDERAKEGSWKEADGLARKWFSERVRGDFDVRALLESDGYDEFGNRRARR